MVNHHPMGVRVKLTILGGRASLVHVSETKCGGGGKERKKSTVVRNQKYKKTESENIFQSTLKSHPFI